MTRWTAILILATTFVFAGPARADEDGDDGGDAAHLMTIGDPAPDIDITHWVKGVEMDPRGNFTPITHFGDGRVYVLEFWATWCGPCVRNMPHLSELQERFKDRGVTVIGVSDESLPKVTSFLFSEDRVDGKLQNDRTHYILTTDPDQSVKRDYFLAAGQTGIPCAFVIGKDGHVEWIGHPFTMDEPLEAIVDGTWDREAFRVEFEEQRAWNEAMRELRALRVTAQREGVWTAYLEALDALLAKRPDDTQLLWTKFQALLTVAGDPDAAYEVGRKLVDAHWDEAPLLNQVAWTVVDDDAVVRRDLDFALKVAERANELTKSEDPAILDTLARVHHDRGDLDKALQLQRLAAEKAGDDPMGEGIRKVLRLYEEEAASSQD